jgi:2-hydroxymuconate-semialdehyde hydrolase
MTLKEHDITVDGMRARLYEAGQGFPVLLMHGAGPGTSVPANFGRVLKTLTERYHVFGTDLIGFGASGRKNEEPYFDYPLWLKQAEAALAAMPEGDKGIIGHSISATLGLRLAGRHADVTKLILTGAMGTAIEVNADLETLWTFPGNAAALRRSLDILFYDSSFVTEAMLRDRIKVLQEGDYRSYFERMFGGDKAALIRPTVLTSDELARVTCDVAIIHGRNDAAFPVETTGAVLAKALPQADLHALSRCGHGPAAERPESFLKIALDFFG